MRRNVLLSKLTIPRPTRRLVKGYATLHQNVRFNGPSLVHIPTPSKTPIPPTKPLSSLDAIPSKSTAFVHLKTSANPFLENEETSEVTTDLYVDEQSSDDLSASQMVISEFELSEESRLVGQNQQKKKPRSELAELSRKLGIPKNSSDRSLDKTKNLLRSQHPIPSLDSWNNLLRAYCLRNDFTNCQEVFDTMISRGVKPNSYSFSFILRSFYFSCKFEPMLHYFRLALEQKIEFSLILLSQGLVGCTVENDEKTLLMIYEEMMKRENLLSEVKMFNQCMTFFSRQGNTKMVEKIYQDMLKKGVQPNEYICNTRITAYSKAKNRDTEKIAEATHDLMKYSDLGPTSAFHHANALITSLCKTGHWDQAVTLMEDMESTGLESNYHMWITLIHALGHAGKPDKAVEAFRKMIAKGFEPDIVGFNALLDVMIVNGKYIDASSCYEELLLKGLQPTAVTYHLMIRRAKLQRDYDGVLRWFQEMIDQGIKPLNPATFKVVLKAIHHRSDLKAMLNCWKLFKELKLTPSIHHFQYLMSAAVKAQRFGLVHEFYAEFRALKCEPDCGILELLIVSYANEGKIEPMERAWKFYQSKKMPFSTDVFSALMMGWDRVDDVDKILQALTEANSLYSERPLQLYSIPLTICARLAKFKELEILLSEYLETGYEPSLLLIENILRSLSLARLKHSFNLQDNSMRNLYNRLHILGGRATLFQVTQRDFI